MAQQNSSGVDQITLDLFSSEGAPDVPPAAESREALMADFSIAYDGLSYHYESYRYDRLEDAVAYARLQRSRAGSGAGPPMPTPSMLEAPGDAEQLAMSSAGITYKEGLYRLGEYRYARLDDALAYARLQRVARPKGGSV